MGIKWTFKTSASRNLRSNGMAIPRRPWRLTDGHVIKDADGEQVPLVSNDRAVLELVVKAINKLSPQATAPGMCVLCGVNPVCAEEGFDTCSWCKR